MDEFKLVSEYQPTGDQPTAIEALVQGVEKGLKGQTLLGVTGSGKTSQSLLPMILQDFQSDNFVYESMNVVQMGQIILEPKGKRTVI